MKKKILVFGADGFIGTYLIHQLLIQDYDVIVSDISNLGMEYYNGLNVPYYSIDITKNEEFDKLPDYRYDAVIHLAAVQPANVSTKTYDPKNYINVNVIGTLNILEFCRKVEAVKLIYATSHRNTQGMWKTHPVISEKNGRSIKYTGQYSMFSISETAAQDCVFHYDAEYGLNTIIFSLPPVYGYGPHTEIFMDGKPIKTGFRIFIDNAKSCKPIELWGDSSKGRDIVYVKDVVAAFVKAIENEKASGLYNISSGYALTLREEAETIAKVFWGSNTQPIITEYPEKQNNIESYVYDISKAERELNWKPAYKFKDMLMDIIIEEKNSRFDFLVEKRKRMLSEDASS
jgi:UDP-glucose 4-epimerase